MIFVSEDYNLITKKQKRGSAHGICLCFLAGFLPKMVEQNPKKLVISKGGP